MTYKEIYFLRNLKHENILGIKDTFYFDKEKDIFMVYEYMETDLHSVIRANILEDIHKRYITFQLLNAVEYLHSLELVHRNIKVFIFILDFFIFYLLFVYYLLFIIFYYYLFLFFIFLF